MFLITTFAARLIYCRAVLAREFFSLLNIRKHLNLIDVLKLKSRAPRMGLQLPQASKEYSTVMSR
jgi:hypothetical protein